MDLVYNSQYFFPRKQEDLGQLPLDKLNCTINKYIIEKFFIVNCNYITRREEYPFLAMNVPNQQISNNYLLKINKCYELGGEYFCFQRKKMNFVIFLNKNEQKIKDLYAMLFYIYNNNPNEEDSINVTILMSSYTYLTDFKPNCIFHDKPYHFFTDYCTQNKVDYEKFTKTKVPKFKVINLNMYDVASLNILIDLDVKPIFLPQFIIYDKNYKILYKDNLFQETPERFVEICQKIFKFISEPYDPKKDFYLGTRSPIRIGSFFEKIEKEIKNNSIFKNEEEFLAVRSMILDKCLKQEKNQKRGKTCKVYFITRVQNLNYDLSNSAISKITYVKPFVFQNSNSSLPDFLYGSNFIKFTKLLHNGPNEYLSYTYQCAKSYISNTGMKCEMSFETKKKVSNLTILEKREFNIEYTESFENYYIPLNFKILFRDKMKFFTINLFPKLNKEETFKILFKDINDNDKEFIIQENEITILQYFREDLFIYQIDLSEKINTLKQMYPNIKFKYCILVLIPCDKFKNSIHYDGIMKFLNSCKQIDEVLVFTYVINDFKQLTKYITNGPFIYIFDQNKQSVSFEVFPGDRKRIEEWFLNSMTKILNPYKWKFNISKNQYKELKELKSSILELYGINSEKEIISLFLTKKKMFDSPQKCFYFVEVVKCGEDEKMRDKLLLLQKKIKTIIGNESEKVCLI